MRPLTIIGNWKMNGSLSANQQLIQAMLGLGLTDLAKSARLALCVPYPYLIQVADLLANSGVALGAQDISDHPNGAYTGDVSANMLQELGCQYVIVGHSERRQYHHEGDGLVARKAKAALQANMTPIICVGETEEEHDDGKALVVVRRQLQAVLDLLQGQVASCVLAYEPVWAIGTGKVATEEQAEAVCAAIRVALGEVLGDAAAQRTRILYGGSVKANNIAGFMRQPNIDGALVGGASLDVAEFSSIARFQKHVI